MSVVLSIPAGSQSRPVRRLSAWMLLLLALVAGGVYANTLYNGFAFDDITIVRDNPHILNYEWTAIWTDNYWPKTNGIQPDALYRPLTLWTYIANQALAPGAAWAFHLTNVLFHMLVTVMLALLTWRIFASRAVAIVTALLFAVHPLHTEAVSNTVGRAELLAALWSLAALLVYLPSRPLSEESGPRPRPWYHGFIVAACFFAAILSKETPATLLLIFPFLDLWRFSRWTPATRPGVIRWLAGQTFRYYLPLLAAFGIYLALRINACGFMTDTRAIHPIVNLLVNADPLQRLITPFALFAKYLALTFWPIHLSADYSAPSLLPVANPISSPAVEPMAPYALAGILICALALIAFLRTWRNRPQIALVIGLFFISYFLVSNAIRIGTIFGERLFYWPSAFILMLVAWALVQFCLLQREKSAIMVRTACIGLLAAACIAMSLRTFERNTDWADNVPLAIATGRDNPQSAKACYWAGNILVLSDKPEFVAIGESLLERAVELYPNFAAADWEIAKHYGREGDLGKSLIYLAHAVRLDAGTRDARVALPAITNDLANADPGSYMREVDQYYDEHPEDPVASFILAVAHHGQGNYEEAEAYALEAIDRDIRNHIASGGPGDMPFFEAAAELGSIRFDSGKRAEGIAMFRGYVMRVTNCVEARCTIADMLLSLDPKENPYALGEAEMNLAKAELVEPGSPRIRAVRGELGRRRYALRDSSITADALDHRPAPASINTGGQP